MVDTSPDPDDDDLFSDCRSEVGSEADKSSSNIIHRINNPRSPESPMNHLVSRQPQGLEASIRDRLNIGRPPMEDPVEEYLYVNVADPHKVGEGMSSYMAYKVMTRTNLRCFRRGSFTVVRRYSDFLGLHEKLVARYQSKGRIIPPAPEKNIIGETILFNRPFLLLNAC